MTSGLRPLDMRLVDALADSADWMTPNALQVAVRCSKVALEDALSDLVIEGRVTWRENVGYRLSATQLCRLAAQQMRRRGLKAAVMGRVEGGEYLVGVAEQRSDIGLVMYELALPLPAPGPDFLEAHLKQVNGVLGYFNGLEANRGSSV